MAGNKKKQNKNAVPGLEPQQSNVTTLTGGGSAGQPKGFGPAFEKTPGDNIAQLYRQTLRTQLRNNPAMEKFGRSGIKEIMTHKFDKTGFDPNAFDLQHNGNGLLKELANSPNFRQVARLQRRMQNAPRVTNRLAGFLGTEGYTPEESNAALQQYLSQDLAAGRYAPNQYRAPNKFDLVNSVHATGAPGQTPYSQQTNQATDEQMVMINALRDIMHQRADAEYENNLRKASYIKDPDQQAQTLSQIETYYNLQKFQADAMAAQNLGGSPGGSLAQIMGASNAGAAKNIRNLYGEADGANAETATGTQAYEDDFLAQLLADQ
jgi:hypothetical protein